MFGFQLLSSLLMQQKNINSLLILFLMRTAGSVQRFLQPVLNISENKFRKYFL